MNDLSAASAETLTWQGTRYRTILASAATQGAMSIVESLRPPGGSPPRHIHQDADEAFVILGGEVEFWLAGERFARGPGQTAFVPRGTEHTFRVLGTQPSRHLAILTPGGFEGFFADMARGQYRIPEDTPAIIESGTRHSPTIPGPPLGAE